MSKLYHKELILSRGIWKFYDKTSAPKRPIKQAQTSKIKNVISTSSLYYIYRQKSMANLRKKQKKGQKNFGGGPHFF
jgi:glucan-binding YG repeat protein